jgi:hypothetical protein
LQLQPTAETPQGTTKFNRSKINISQLRAGKEQVVFSLNLQEFNIYFGLSSNAVASISPVGNNARPMKFPAILDVSVADHT